MEAHYFTILQWLLPYIDTNQPWVHMYTCPPSWTPSKLPPRPIPQGRPSAPALSTLSHASNLDWRSISHMVIFVSMLFQIFNEHFIYLFFYLPLCFLKGFPVGSGVKNPPANAGDAGSIPGSGRSPGEGNGHSLYYYSCLGKPMDRGAWRATVHSVAKSQTQLKQLSSMYA